MQEQAETLTDNQIQIIEDDPSHIEAIIQELNKSQKVDPIREKSAFDRVHDTLTDMVSYTFIFKLLQKANLAEERASMQMQCDVVALKQVKIETENAMVLARVDKYEK